jgi:hypothetical protein
VWRNERNTGIEIPEAIEVVRLALRWRNCGRFFSDKFIDLPGRLP